MANEFELRAQQILAESPYIRAITKPGRELLSAKYYGYDIQIGTVAAPLVVNVPQFGNIETQADSDFAVTGISACVQGVANGAFTYGWNMLLQIQDLSSGKFFYSRPTIMSMATGAGGFPFVLSAPRVINPNSSLAVTVTNRNPATNPVGFFIVLHGIRLFYK